MGKAGRLRRGKKTGPFLWGLVGLVLMGALVWFGLGRLDFDEPQVSLKPPGKVVGPKTTFTLEAGDDTSGLREVKVTFSQGDREKVVLIRSFPPGGDPGSRVELPFTLEPRVLGFKEGKATLTAMVRDRSWRDWFRGRTATLSRETVIDLVPLNLTFLSVNHLLRPGGTGVICYRVNKTPKESGVLMGGVLYRGYPNPKGSQGDYVVLFPIPQEPAGVPQVELVARSEWGGDVKQGIPLKLKPKKWRHDRMNLSEQFLRQVAATFTVSNPADLLSAYLEVNRELRRKNHARVRQVCSQSQPQPLWAGAFQRFLGKPMARFGDRRTYYYQNREVDRQVHLGEDLASLVHSKVPAANHGVVVLAEPLGIYGQTVILDHGLGVFSMYSHLSKIEVQAGDRVKKGDTVGLTGSTGLAGGDHLHFSVMLQGEFVNPVEWWDSHWLKDQVEGQWARPGVATEAAGAASPALKKGKGKKKPGKSKARPGKSKRHT